MMNGSRILLAEPHEAIRQYLATLLARLEIDVVTAATPEEAEAALRSGPFDLILYAFDDALPRLASCDVPVVAFTERWHDRPPPFVRGLLRKPFGVDELVETLGEILGPLRRSALIVGANERTPALRRALEDLEIRVHHVRDPREVAPLLRRIGLFVIFVSLDRDDRSVVEGLSSLDASIPFLVHADPATFDACVADLGDGVVGLLPTDFDPAAQLRPLVDMLSFDKD
jgi:DNA-binding NtrC family response regulator